MKNFTGGLKRFLSNKNTITILAVIVGILVLWFAYNMRVQQAIKPQLIPYALERIGATEPITTENIGYIEVNADMLSKSDIITSAALLDGKFITTGTSIPKGGFFHQSQVVEGETLPNTVFDHIEDGHGLFSLRVDNDSTYGNSIYPGDRIDLYVKYVDELGIIVFGKFIESIEVLAVRDSRQDDVFDSEDPSNPSLLLFSLPEDTNNPENNLFYWLTQASFIPGLEIIPVPRNKAYTEEDAATKITSYEIQAYIELYTRSALQ